MHFFLKWDKETEAVEYNELLLLIEPDFSRKGIKKYENYIDNNIYNIIRKGTYKKMSVKSMKWEFSFKNLVNEGF